MTIGIWYWIVFLLWILLSGWLSWRPDVAPPWVPNVFVFLLLLLLGLATFGSPIR